jgi:hypothetical protein
MKLFIDDIRKAPDDSWHLARTITDAISAIAVFDFEVISLDHDISHQVVMLDMSRPYACNENFSAVAQFIVEKYRECEHRTTYGCEVKKPKIIIHTANPAGFMRIAGILKDFEIERVESYPANRLETQL